MYVVGHGGAEGKNTLAFISSWRGNLESESKYHVGCKTLNYMGLMCMIHDDAWLQIRSKIFRCTRNFREAEGKNIITFISSWRGNLNSRYHVVVCETVNTELNYPHMHGS